jgi:hypothetical protein
VQVAVFKTYAALAKANVPGAQEAAAKLICEDLCGDWFLAKYANNFFAKSFVPQPERVQQLATQVEPENVCLTCWHDLRRPIPEDETHVCMRCPLYGKARQDMLAALKPDTWETVSETPDDHDKLLVIMSSLHSSDWDAFDLFTTRIAQIRRATRKKFEQREARLLAKGFANQRRQWRASGQYVCRHGVFFAAPPNMLCACIGPASCTDKSVWWKARWMPHLDADLKAITIVPFQLNGLRRLGVIQAEMKKKGWQ